MREEQTGGIPQPKTYGPLGNYPLFDMSQPTISFCEMAKEYGPIFRLTAPGFKTICISEHKLVTEVCDINRFDKHVANDMVHVREFTGDGLFTSKTTEPNWRKAHNILLPTFSQQAMKGYHTMMLDIALQLIQKWARLNHDSDHIDVPGDMTRLTLDTIGLCGFNYRFNSFYKEKHDPFIDSMVRALDEAMHKIARSKGLDTLMIRKNRQFQDDIQSMFSLVDKIIKERKANGNNGEIDLLARMLNSKDPETGEVLDDENIRYQIITFLIAGHETTSGLLSFTTYFLLKHPEVLKKAYEEVDQVLGDSTPSYKQVLNLKYIRMILNEAIRLWPTAPSFDVYPKEDTIIGGQYHVKKGEGLTVLLPALHRDKEVWGEDAEEFRPERFADPSKVPNHAYKPFGNGQRACIGMQFALYEATLVLGMILQKLELIDSENYQLKIKQSLTIKPENFRIRVKLREGKEIAPLLNLPLDDEKENEEKKKVTSQYSKQEVLEGAENVPLLVLYGSNLGRAEEFARKLADHARLLGFQSDVRTLNDYIGKLPKEGAVLIVTSSYNGQPPENAAQFVKWLEQASAEECTGIRYAVFGCGDRNWANTYQSVPKFIDKELELKGAIRYTERGEADAGGDFENDFAQWQKNMWKDVSNVFGLKMKEGTETVSHQSSLSVQLISGPHANPIVQKNEVVYATVIASRELQSSESERSTRHIEIALPEGVTYQVGDHLGVLPSNSRKNVRRILKRFKLNGKDQVILSASGSSSAHLPVDRPVSLFDLLSYNVEIQEAATRAQIRELARFTVCPPHKYELEALLEDGVYQDQILKKHISMLDLLEKYEACEIPFERFLELLPALKPRYYSISSSPLVAQDRLSITVGVVSGPAWSGQGEYKGVASNYLAQRHNEDEITCFIRTPESRFQLPEDRETPIIMVGPGTGVAPFRGFLQTRRVQKQKGVNLGEAHLYFGCRHPEKDYLYRTELENDEKDGLISLHTAFSRSEGHPKTYVQHLMKQDGANLISLLDSGAHLYICGDGSRMAPDVEDTLCHAYQEIHEVSEQEARNWLNQLQHEGRYGKDVWAGI
ncbi:bifunctional cytochrome P450/NADPH--P450 reductase [Bacillus toyonensis]|uniref:bifunctional cytochrome P450/NADPH--P450 reductase n=1 Tax=Bacillus toyonensis TaxID=155322 RepID=UPI001570A30D|nr:bifunctional cytochrome P450/NADPH--P450 reductase [Bacillus toyonensis]NSL69449.1 cytochrome P450 [Bacillus toyonensis]